jgi:hypothetical protein
LRAFLVHVIIALIVTIFLLSIPGCPVFLLEETSNSVNVGDPSKADVDLEDWAIYNGCISSHRIQNIKIVDNRFAILRLVDGKQVKIHFMASCEGIMQNGFVFTSRNNLFCTHSYSVRVLHTGKHCQVDSLEPYFGKATPVVRDVTHDNEVLINESVNKKKDDERGR